MGWDLKAFLDSAGNEDQRQRDAQQAQDSVNLQDVIARNRIRENTAQQETTQRIGKENAVAQTPFLNRLLANTPDVAKSIGTSTISPGEAPGAAPFVKQLLQEHASQGIADTRAEVLMARDRGRLDREFYTRYGKTPQAHEEDKAAAIAKLSSDYAAAQASGDPEKMHSIEAELALTQNANPTELARAKMRMQTRDAIAKQKMAEIQTKHAGRMQELAQSGQDAFKRATTVANIMANPRNDANADARLNTERQVSATNLQNYAGELKGIASNLETIGRIPRPGEDKARSEARNALLEQEATIQGLQRKEHLHLDNIAKAASSVATRQTNSARDMLAGKVFTTDRVITKGGKRFNLKAGHPVPDGYTVE